MSVLRPALRITLSFGLVVLVVLAVVAARGAPVASAQSSPFSAYGVGLPPGSEVTATAGGQQCAVTHADAEGNWLMMIGASTPCAPTEGQLLNFLVNGQLSGETVPWVPGGTPETSGYPAATGIPLSAAAPAPAATAASTPAAVPTANVTPATAPAAPSGGAATGPAPTRAPTAPDAGASGPAVGAAGSTGVAANPTPGEVAATAVAAPTNRSALDELRATFDDPHWAPLGIVLAAGILAFGSTAWLVSRFVRV